MSWLLDVNLLLASRWISHPDHAATQKWLDSVDQFYTSAITELGFVRISLSKAYGATWNETLETLRLNPRFRFPAFRFYHFPILAFSLALPSRRIYRAAMSNAVNRGPAETDYPEIRKKMDGMRQDFGAETR